MEIKMEKSIIMLVILEDISLCLESQEPFTHIWSISYVPIRCSSVVFRDSDRMQLR